MGFRGTVVALNEATELKTPKKTTQGMKTCLAEPFPPWFGTENKASVLAQFSHTLPRPTFLGLESGHV